MSFFETMTMQKMSISSTDEDVEDVTPFTVFPSAGGHLLNYLFDSVIAKAIAALSVVLVLYALFTVKTSQSSDSSTFFVNSSQAQSYESVRPKYIRDVLHSAAADATAKGVLIPIPITKVDRVVDGKIEVHVMPHSLFQQYTYLIICVRVCFCVTSRAEQS
jgi:hypothetical protein